MLTTMEGVVIELNCRTGCGEENQAGRHFVGSQEKWWHICRQSK